MLPSLLVLAAVISPVFAYPTELDARMADRPPPLLLQHRRTTDPYFPADPPSCPVCEQKYADISSCAAAAPVFANASAILFNPTAFVDVLNCACTDTFQSVFPQCVDCFERTNQTAVLGTPDLPSVVSGMREVCALVGTLLGGSGVSRSSAVSDVSTSSSEASVETSDVTSTTDTPVIPATTTTPIATTTTPLIASQTTTDTAASASGSNGATSSMSKNGLALLCGAVGVLLFGSSRL